MKEPKNKYIKTILAVIGAVVIGAIGSGVWDLVLKHFVISGRDMILNIISLGMKSVKDMTYSQIARGFHEEPNMNILTILICFLIFGTAIALIIPFVISRLNRRIRQKLIDRIVDRIDSMIRVEKPEESMSDAPASIAKTQQERWQDARIKLEELRGSLMQRKSKLLSVVEYIMVFVGIIWTSFSAADLTRFSYVNSAITHYQQIMVITAPYVDEFKRKEITSSFGQIKNKDDYVAIIQHLEHIARQNQQYVPPFSAW